MLLYLPTELIINVLKHINDPASLDSAICSCKFVFNLLQNNWVQSELVGKLKPRTSWKYMYKIHCMFYDLPKSIRRLLRFLPFAKLLRIQSQALQIIRLKNVALINGYLRSVCNSNKNNWMTRTMIQETTCAIVAGFPRPVRVSESVWQILNSELSQLIDFQPILDKNYETKKDQITYQIVEEVLNGTGPNKKVFLFTMMRGLKCALRSNINKKHKSDIRMFIDHVLI